MLERSLLLTSNAAHNWGSIFFLAFSEGKGTHGCLYAWHWWCPKQDFTSILQSSCLQKCIQEDTERNKFTLELWKMVIVLYWPLPCQFLALTSKKTDYFLEQADFTLTKLNLTMQIKQIFCKLLTQTVCMVKEFGRKVTVESKTRWHTVFEPLSL